MTKRLSVVVLFVAACAAGPVAAQEPAAAPAPGAAPAPAAGQPANICQELLAFLKPPAPANPPATTPVAPQQQSAVSAPTGKGEEKAGGAAGGVQQNSGLSGPITGDTTGSPAGSPAAGDAAKPASDGRSSANIAAKSPAAAAPAAPPTKPSPEAVAQAEAAVTANDPGGCRGSVQAMRRQGVTLPSPLIALGALDPKFYAAR
jgi:hypothetical protein